MSLPFRNIVIRDHQLMVLQQDVWSNHFVDAYLRTDKGLRPIKLRYRGGHTREYPKKSFEIITGGRTVHLNAEYDDPSMIRNALSFRFFQWIGVPSPKTRHCLLRLNGENLGVYLEIEAVDRRFFRRRGIPVKSLIYAVNDAANFSLKDPDTLKRKSSLFTGYKLMIGTDAERSRLISLISKLHTLPSARLQSYLRANLDVDIYLRWLAGAVCTGNYDGFEQNYALFRHARNCKYGIIPWDYEGTWGRNCYGKRCSSDLVRVMGYNDLTQKLLNSKKTRTEYKCILKKVLHNAFTLNRLIPEVRSLHDRISPYIYADRTRKWDFTTFDREPEFISQYIEERRSIIKKAIAKL